MEILKNKLLICNIRISNLCVHFENLEKEKNQYTVYSIRFQNVKMLNQFRIQVLDPRN